MQITPQLLYLVEILDAATLTGNGPQAVQIELPQGAHWSAFCTYELASMLMALDCIAAMPFNIFRHLWSNRLQQTSERFRKEIFDPEHLEHPSDFYDAPGDLRRGISSRVHSKRCIFPVCDCVRRTRFNTSAASNGFKQSAWSSTLWQVA